MTDSNKLGAVERFVDALLHDAALRSELQSQTESGAELAQAACQLGAERGLQFATEDCKAYLEDLLHRVQAGSELSDTELELVSGGVTAQQVWEFIGPGTVNHFKSAFIDPVIQHGPSTVKNIVSGQGCFLTTACCTARGLPDDCEELSAFRRLRDDFLRQQPLGEALADEYYRVAPRIVAAIDARPDADARWEALYQSLVVPNARRIQAGELASACADALAQYQALKRRYL